MHIRHKTCAREAFRKLPMDEGEDTHIKLAVPKLRLENDVLMRGILNCSEDIVCCGLKLPL